MSRVEGRFIAPQNTPTNYTPSSSNLDGHLDGINTALAASGTALELTASGLITNGASIAATGTVLVPGNEYIMCLFASMTGAPLIGTDIDMITDFGLVAKTSDEPFIQAITAGFGVRVSNDPNGSVARGVIWCAVGTYGVDLITLAANHDTSTDVAQLLLKDTGAIHVGHDDSGAGSSRNGAWAVLRFT